MAELPVVTDSDATSAHGCFFLQRLLRLLVVSPRKPLGKEARSEADLQKGSEPHFNDVDTDITRKALALFCARSVKFALLIYLWHHAPSEYTGLLVLSTLCMAGGSTISEFRLISSRDCGSIQKRWQGGHEQRGTNWAIKANIAARLPPARSHPTGCFEPQNAIRMQKNSYGFLTPSESDWIDL